MSRTLLIDLFAALNIVGMERQQDGSFALLGAAPEWFLQVYPEAAAQQDALRLELLSPFLENFLVDAELFWHRHTIGQLPSGVWVEVKQDGESVHLEATAVCMPTRQLLLLVLRDATYRETLTLVQKAREHQLLSEHLGKEIQRKEILLHCIVHDLMSPLTAMMSCISLLRLEELDGKARHYVDVAMREATRQQRMIQQILDVFATEMGAPAAQLRDPAQAPDVVACAREVVAALLPVSLLHKLHLQLTSRLDTARSWKVVGDRSRLERVLFNLVENAIRHSPPGGTVTIGLQESATQVLITVDDAGSGVPANMVETLFQKFSQASERAGKIGLGLYFCRMMTELWGGSIGYTPRPEGGARFWVRLPQMQE